MRHLYVHIPFCAKKCRYCNFFSRPVEQYDQHRFIRCLLEEAGRWDLSCVDTVYFGGGSPSILENDLLIELAGELLTRAADVRECTVEINPAQADRGLLTGLRQTGVNRLSIGAQSFHDDELEFLGRAHKTGEIERTFHQAREVGFVNINLDLIFAIPGSCMEKFEFSLQKALMLGSDHISAYSLTCEPGTPLAEAVEEGDVMLMDEKTDLKMYFRAIDLLTSWGVTHYEISNFAQPGRECLHNLACWENSDFLGLGPAAHSWLFNLRSKNVPDILTWMERIEKGQDTAFEKNHITAMDRVYETAMLNLRRMKGIQIAHFKQRTGFDPRSLFSTQLGRLTEAGLIESNSLHICLTRKGLAVADSVISEFSGPD